jgi:hypothetical protein
MALFTLTDITFKKDSQGPLTKLDDPEVIGLDTNVLKYPVDLGSYDKGHYMIFYINEQVNTQYSDASQFTTGPTVQRFREVLQAERGPTNLGQQLGNLGSAIESTAKEALSSDTADQVSNLFDKARNVVGSKVDPLGQSEIAKKAIEGSKALFTQGKEGFGKALDVMNNGSFLRKVRRTKQAIALYMPDTLNFVYSQSYNDLAVFDTLGNVGTALAAGSSLVDAVKSGANQNAPVNVASFGLEFLRKNASGAIGNLANIGLAQLGVASNPGLEVIYGSPSFRTFRFDFLFYPRSKQEGETVQGIINSLKFHQAPEYASQTGGKFLIPPSEFDIEFYHNGKINPNIPKISTCVLTSIDLDYAPNGFSAYEVPAESASIGGTGMPVAIRMSLNFKETQIVTKEYLRWAATGAPNAQRTRTPEEVEYSKSLGDFPG